VGSWAAGQTDHLSWGGLPSQLCSPQSGLHKEGYSGPSEDHRHGQCADTCGHRGQKAVWGERHLLSPLGQGEELSSAIIMAPWPVALSLKTQGSIPLTPGSLLDLTQS
jgi:hypothetical protein